MDDNEDPLDLLGDDGDGVIEMCLLDEEEKRAKGSGNHNSGCCILLLSVGASTALSIWGLTQIV